MLPGRAETRKGLRAAKPARARSRPQGGRPSMSAQLVAVIWRRQTVLGVQILPGSFTDGAEFIARDASI
jgi:hypothetical protein